MRLRSTLALLLAGLPLGACSSDPTATPDAPAPAVAETTPAPHEPLPDPSPVEAVEMEGLVPLHRVGDLWLGGQPDEVALEALAAEGLRTVIDLRRPEEERGFDEADVAGDALGLDYLQLGFGGPEPLTDEIFQRARRAMAKPEAGGVLLHCASSNRVGAVWLARRVLDEGVPWDTALEEAHAVGLRSASLEESARAYVLGAGNQEFGRLKLELREALPEVDVIGVAQLAERLAAGDDPLLIDVRAPEEYAVSHLPGAQHAQDVTGVLELLERTGAAHAQREVILYCSIGYRSGYLAEDLRRAGVEGVRNLEGSIFEWANAGHPVYREGRPTDEVHPYDEQWGRFLKRELWSELR